MTRQLAVATLEGAAQYYAGLFVQDRGPHDQEWVIKQMFKFDYKDEYAFVAERLRDHDDIFYDMATPNAHAKIDILDSMRDLGHPIYFEIRAGNRVVQDYLFPIESPVADLRYEEESVAVMLIWSAAIHTLMRNHPQFDAFIALLEDSKESGAVLLVTDDDLGRAIVDVRPALD